MIHRLGKFEEESLKWRPILILCSMQQRPVFGWRKPPILLGTLAPIDSPARPRYALLK